MLALWPTNVFVLIQKHMVRRDSMSMFLRSTDPTRRFVVCVRRQALRKTTAQCRVLFLTVLLPVVIGLFSGTDVKWYFFGFPVLGFITTWWKLAELILFKPDCKVLRWFWFLSKTCIWKRRRTDYSLWRFWPPSSASEYHQPSNCSKVSVHTVAFTKIWIFCVRSMWFWCASWHW